MVRVTFSRHPYASPTGDSREKQKSSGDGTRHACCDLALPHKEFGGGAFNAEPNLSESDLIGEKIIVGSAVLRVVKPIKRCVVPGYDLHGGPRIPEVQTYVVRERENIMGVYCEVVSAGEVQIRATLAKK
jgi:hypothetical protein